MRIRETLTRWTKRGQDKGLKIVLQDLSKELRTDAVPAALRQAAQAVAGVLEGKREAGDAGSPNAMIINIAISVAVGAPGKEQDGDADPGTPANEAVVIASAIATSPAKPTSKRSAENQPEPRTAKRRA